MSSSDDKIFITVFLGFYSLAHTDYTLMHLFTVKVTPNKSKLPSWHVSFVWLTHTYLWSIHPFILLHLPALKEVP